MDMSVTEGTIWQRIFSDRGFTAISHYFVMDWASVWKDIFGGLLLAGAFGAWIPKEWWQGFFFSRDPLISAIWGPLIGPLVSVISFVCSIGNVPLAAVLWNGGISFGGVIAFIFADLIVLPILDIYRKYYGGRVALFIAGTFYVSMVLAAWVIEALFGALHLIPAERNAQIVEASVQLNYTSVLNVLFLLLAGALVWRFLNTGGPEMLKMMDMAPEQRAHMAKDPVCGMTVDPRTATEHATYRGQTYLFCSSGCRATFEQNPERYVGTERRLSPADARQSH